jgi:peptide subunit release factor 1 (eRF1)
MELLTKLNDMVGDGTSMITFVCSSSSRIDTQMSKIKHEQSMVGNIKSRV